MRGGPSRARRLVPSGAGGLSPSSLVWGQVSPLPFLSSLSLTLKFPSLPQADGVHWAALGLAA